MGIFFHSREYVKGMEINEIKGIFIMFTSETIKPLIQLEKKIHCFYTYNFKKMPIHERSSVFKDIRLQKVQNYREKHISKGAHIHFRKER